MGTSLTKRGTKYGRRNQKQRRAAYTKAGPVTITRGEKTWTEAAYDINELARVKAGGRPRSQRKIPVRQRRYVFLRDGGKCRYCGRVCDERTRWEIDHVRPISEGGNDHSSNLVLACRRCNQSKGMQMWVPRPLG